MVALPSDPAVSLRTGLPLHNGGHLGSYYQHVRELARRLNDDFRAGAFATDADVLDAITGLENRVRSDLVVNDVIRLQTGDRRPRP